MQNNEHSESNRFRKFFQEKGYYIVLLLCILAVGISGYIFVSGAVSEKKALNEQTLSVATSAEIPEDKPSSSSSGGISCCSTPTVLQITGEGPMAVLPCSVMGKACLPG